MVFTGLDRFITRPVVFMIVPALRRADMRLRRFLEAPDRKWIAQLAPRIRAGLIFRIGQEAALEQTLQPGLVAVENNGPDLLPPITMRVMPHG